MRFFTLVDLAVGAIAVRCAHALGTALAGSIARSPTAFLAIGAGESPGGRVRAHASVIHQIRQWLKCTIRLRNPDKCVGCQISPT
jgi:acyl-coenzyme A thioesterase PaaI-like protein